ncbi:TPA: restriction endonuclease subunit S [Escherichia coli]|nr:restriction endonuclease subunit S [Escherichia coli]
MSELSYLEKLLDGVEVEWLPLSGLARIRNGKDHKSLSEGEFPVYGSGGIMRYVDTYAYNKPSVLIPRKGSLGNLFFVNVPFWTVDTIFYTEIDEAQIRPKYLYYFLTTVGLGEMNQAGGVPSQTQSVLNKLKIPIPCPGNPQKSLAIQSEIVRILDKFTAVTAELTAELNMRKKQYNYYRDQLLSFDEEQEKPVYLEKLLDGVEVEWRTLGEIAVIYDGTHKTPKYTASGVPFVSVQNIKNLYGTNKYISPEDFKTYKNKPRKHDLFMTRIGDVGTCAIVEDDRPLAYYVTLALIRINQQIAVPGFIRYLIESRFGKAELYKRTLIHAVPMKINLGEIGKVAVPIPCPDNPEKSLAIQSEIVRILDKFDTLTNSITEGLPREIELRQKQYEYYRDLLFSFPKPETASN